MKKILSTALVLSLMLGTAAVKAETQVTDLVPLYDFNGTDLGVLDDAGLAALGITADTDGKAEISIVDLSEDKDYGSLGKVLQYKATSAESEAGVLPTSIRFPMNYELNENENLVVEYDMRYYAYSENDWLNSANWGNVGLSRFTIEDGGVGKVFHVRPRPNNKVITLADRRQYQNGNTSSGYQQWFKMKLVYDYEEYQRHNVENDITSQALKITARNLKTGKTVLSGVEEVTAWINGTTAGDLTFSENAGIGMVQLDNIHVYTVPKFKLVSTSIADGERGVFYDTKAVSAEFTNDIKNTDALNVKLNGSAIDKSLYTVEVTGNKVTVSFNDNLKYDANYTFDFNGIIDALDQAVENASISFTTEAAPDVQLGKIKLTSGIGNTYSAVTEFSSKNGLQGVAMELTNTADENKNASVIFAVYEGEGKTLRNVIYTQTVIPAGETKEISAGLQLSDANKGGIVKAFVWEDMMSMNPWLRNTQIEIK